MPDAVPTQLYVIQGKKANKDFKAARTLYPLRPIDPNSAYVPPALLRQDATLSTELPATPKDDKKVHFESDVRKEA